MTDPDGQVTRYDYDAANWPTFIADPELRRTLKVYNAASEVIEERRAVGTPIEQADIRIGVKNLFLDSWILVPIKDDPKGVREQSLQTSATIRLQQQATLRTLT
jgi:YD repeat-containing protein